MQGLKVAFIGLGVMGYPMAGHLTKKGFSVVVHNRSSEKARKWSSEYEGQVASTAKEAATNCDIIAICVGNDQDVENVILGENGIYSSLKKGAVVIDHTTASARLAKKAYQELKKIDVEFIDAPVSGGGIGAQNGTLSIMAGGTDAAFTKALPVMDCYGASINLMGDVGSGQLTKMVNQILIAGALEGVAEAFTFGLRSGLDMEKVLSVVSKGAAQSWQLENRASWMLNKKYMDGGFTVDLYKKDLELLIDEAKAMGLNIPITSIINSNFSKLQGQGKGAWDFSCLFDLLNS